ncbi:oligosaccharide flippase family protein [Clostridium perfringens]|uniref:oligosaccharide flippase family protein n=1 Tax=Clostridium perfringens TaxID=1502 RepID=UPI0004000985|nr:oligosaccharide flippase family protein [Clostridium perfringens]MDM0800780.1 oligosaccharide flippase family protein [Clostridium perfringens]
MRRILSNMIEKVVFNDKTAKSGIINMMLKPVSMILSLMYTPILLNYLGNEKYGLWATLLSVINWVNYFDVGIGNGLRNLLAKELSEQQYESAKKSVSTAYIVLSLISFVLLLVLIVLTFFFNWELVFSTQIDMKMPLLISFIFICINFVLSISNTILYALQLSEIVSVMGCITQLLNFIGLLVLNATTNSNLVLVAILYGSTTFVMNIINTFYIIKNNRYLCPSIKSFRTGKIGSICKVGVKFFIIQIMALVLFTTDNILITHYFGAEIVTPFSIADKIFNTVYTVFAAFLVPYWSRSTVAFAQGDYDWVKNSLKKVVKIGIVFILGYIVLLFVFKPLVKLWLGHPLIFQKGIPSIMCLFYIMYSVLGIECQFINGSGKINIQLAVYCIAGILNIPLSILLGVYFNMGGFGIRLASVLLILMQIIVLGINVMIIIKDLKYSKNDKK